MVAFLIVLVLLFAVVWAVSSPWRRSGRPALHPADDRIRRASAEVLDLESARDAKYREIRDAELDRQTGKLSDADFTAIDRVLRAEAVALLRDLDRAQARLDRLHRAEAGETAAGGDEPVDGADAAGELNLEPDRLASSADAE